MTRYFSQPNINHSNFLFLECAQKRESTLTRLPQDSFGGDEDGRLRDDLAVVDRSGGDDVLRPPGQEHHPRTDPI